MFENVLTKIKNNFSFRWIAYFFCAFLAFNFSNNIIVFTCLSLLGNVIFLIFGNRKHKDVNLLTLCCCVIPLTGFCVFCLKSGFNLDPNSNHNLTNYIFLIIASISIPFLGFQARAEKKFEIKTAIKIIYCALAFYMLINLLLTLINYGPLYTFIYSDRFFFDYGHIGRLPVGKTAYMLLGFKTDVVTIELFTMFASLLFSAILGVFFVSYNEDKRSFLIYLICGCIGLLCILLTLNKGLIISYLALVVGFSLIILFAKKIIPFNKTTRIVTYSIAGIVFIIFVVFMLSALNVQPIANAIECSPFFNRLFNANRVIGKYHNLIREMSNSKAFSGFTGYLVGNDSVTLSGSWLFDMFAIAGIFGWAVFVVFIILIFVRYFHYCKVNKDDLISKVLVIGVILSFILFTIAGYNSMPYLDNYGYSLMVFMSPFLILLFMYGYIGDREEEETEA